MADRGRVDRTASLSAVQVGSHRRSKGCSKGFDAGKQISGRNRHILADTDGRLRASLSHRR
jgi:hypothetical protein